MWKASTETAHQVTGVSVARWLQNGRRAEGESRDFAAGRWWEHVDPNHGPPPRLRHAPAASRTSLVNQTFFTIQVISKARKGRLRKFARLGTADRVFNGSALPVPLLEANDAPALQIGEHGLEAAAIGVREEELRPGLRAPATRGVRRGRFQRHGEARKRAMRLPSRFVRMSPAFRESQPVGRSADQGAACARGHGRRLGAALARVSGVVAFTCTVILLSGIRAGAREAAGFERARIAPATRRTHRPPNHCTP